MDTDATTPLETDDYPVSDESKAELQAGIDADLAEPHPPWCVTRGNCAGFHAGEPRALTAQHGTISVTAVDFHGDRGIELHTTTRDGGNVVLIELDADGTRRLAEILNRAVDELGQRTMTAAQLAELRRRLALQSSLLKTARDIIAAHDAQAQ